MTAPEDALFAFLPDEPRWRSRVAAFRACVGVLDELAQQDRDVVIRRLFAYYSTPKDGLGADPRRTP